MRRTFAVIILTVLTVLSIEIVIYNLSDKRKDKPAVVEFREGSEKSGYKMINPVLDYYELEPVMVREVRALQSDLSAYIKKAKEEKRIEMASVYYRDLNNGPWVGIGEDEYYAPASLLKVPVMISVLKKAEEEPSFLSRKIRYEPQHKNARRNIVDGTSLQPYKEYTIDELLEFMIIHSDNDAVKILQDNISKESMHDIYYDLGIPIESHTDGNSLSVKEYAAYFRILYNATYLNKKSSEKALTLLSKTTFTQGIVAGVPKGVTVAHKFGERYFKSSDITQLHDCGIVYKGKVPYLICIMTKGKDLAAMEEVIKNISSIVYNSEATMSEIAH